MTAAAMGARSDAPTTAYPGRTARVVLVVVVSVNVAIVETLYFTEGPAKNSLIGVAKFFALNLALVMILQLVLVSRLPWLDRRVGMDRLTSWHRWNGFALFWLVILHPTFILIGYGRLDHLSFFAQFTSFAGVFATLMGMIAAGIVIVAVAFSVRVVRRRLSYETWHAVHFCLYAAVVFALIHQLKEGSTFKANVVTTAYWWLLWGLAIGALLVGRVVTPLTLNARHRLRVAAVVPESDTVTSVYVEGRDLDQLQARPGQFFIWRFLGHNRWWQANPFSLSAAPDGRYLRLTAKAVGSTSAGLRSVPVGTRVFVEGPYGAFTTIHRSREATALIAGGVGITPVRALLEELSGPVTLLYRVHAWPDAVLLRELQDLARARGAELHVLTGRTGAGDPPTMPFEPRNLAALVPDIADRDVYVCGPPAMTSAVLRSLRALGVPKRQIHAERFALAG
jgi:predicted ferric reductase